VLLVPHHRQQLPPPRIAEILSWVDNGGHLIVEAESLGVADPLLDRLGVKRSRAGEATPKPFVLELPQSDRKLTVHFQSAMKLETPEAEVRLRARSSLVSFARGHGLVTVASTLRFARNPSYDDHFFKMAKRPAVSIGALDHAELFWNMLSLTSGRERSLAPRVELRLYYRPERLSLSGFLRENAAPAMLAGGLLLALWIWSIVPRFAPAASRPPARERPLSLDPRTALPPGGGGARRRPAAHCARAARFRWRATGGARRTPGKTGGYFKGRGKPLHVRRRRDARSRLHPYHTRCSAHPQGARKRK